MKMLPLILCLAIGPAAMAATRSDPFAQEVKTFFDESDGLPGNALNDVCLRSDGGVVAAGGGSLALFLHGAWQSMPEPPFPPRHVAASRDALYIAGERQVAVLENGAWTVLPGTADRLINVLYATPESPAVIVGTDYGLFALVDEAFTALPSPQEPILAVAHGPEGELAVGTADALYTRCLGTTSWASELPEDERYRWAPRGVRALTFDGEGRLWFGARQGMGVRATDGTWRLFTGREGLPSNRFTGAIAARGQAVWLGTDRGAIRRGEGGFACRFSKRWLPDDHVKGIAVAEDGTAWFATTSGLGRIERKNMSLDEKAAYFTEQVEARHVRDGFVCDARLERQFDYTSWQPKISDNDGLYTAMYGSAHAFRYAATGDLEAKALAQRSFKACKWLVDITGTGFPARVIIPIDWHEPVNEQYGDAYNRNKQKTDPFWKLITPRFVTSEDGKHLWKCDTSSDELAGHYFFYGIYYDLVAETEEEKQAVRGVLRALTDHLVDNGFLLRDHDGEPTRWGNFSPAFFNSAYGWEQRGLNSMMILSFLAVAEHVTGDAKYAEAQRHLRGEWQYHINAMQSKMYFPADYVVPWDNNLCLMSWYGLFNYERDPELMLLYRLSIEHAWLHVSRQKNPFWNVLHQAVANAFEKRADAAAFDGAFPEYGPYVQFTAAQLRQTETRIEDTLESLRGMPLDLIGYHMDNTFRLDIVHDPAPGQAPAIGWHYDGRALPIEERGHVRQDRDAFNLDANEDNGWAEHEGTFFLLPYWMAVYHGFIE